MTEKEKVSREKEDDGDHGDKKETPDDRENENEKEYSSGIRKRRLIGEDSDGKEGDDKSDEKLSTSSGSSSGINDSSSPDIKRKRLSESPSSSHTEVCLWFLVDPRHKLSIRKPASL